MSVRVAGIGTALPEKVVTNDDLAQHMDTSDAWIRERSGIGERRVGGSTVDMAVEAATAAIAAADLTPDDIGFLVLCTTTPESVPRLQRHGRRQFGHHVWRNGPQRRVCRLSVRLCGRLRNDDHAGRARSRARHRE